MHWKGLRGWEGEESTELHLRTTDISFSFGFGIGSLRAPYLDICLLTWDLVGLLEGSL